MTSVRIPRLFSLAALVAAVVVFTGCDSTDSNEVANECNNLRGTYEAGELAFESIEDPDVRETFNDDASLRITFRGTQFASRFISPQQDTLEVDGYYTVNEEAVPTELNLGDATLIPGTAPGDQTFTCEGEDLGFRLNSQGLGYDLDKNGEYEETRFTGAFDLISRL